VNKREQQRTERREQILNCSLDMIISRGYGAMKIRDIADQLGISTGLFFNYFESKEKVYEELIQIGLSGPANVLQLNGENVPPIELFEKMTAYIFGAIKTYSLTARMFLLMSQSLKSETAPESVKKMLAQFDVTTPLLPVIRRGQLLGQIKPGEPVALLIAYWGAVQGIAENYAFHPELPLPEASWVVDILRA
jgi:AcrR family transcriptional regulator